MKKTRLLSLALALVMLVSMFAGAVPATAQTVESDFATELEANYSDPDRFYGSSIRWWLDKASYTDEVLLQEIQDLYDSGFYGIELCMQGSSSAANADYAYGSQMFFHKWKLMMNKLLDLGMNVSLTSGTNWATTNVTGLNPDSQEASQVIAMSSTQVAAGETVSLLNKPKTMRGVGKFVGAYVSKYDSVGEVTIGRNKYTSYTVDPNFEAINVTELVTPVEGGTVYDQAINWTAPEDGNYVVFAYWTHGNYKSASPAVDPAYAVNYFDARGVGAMREYWEANILNDEELNAKIKEGDVHLFMDSIELNPDGGITWWSEDMYNEFVTRKGYDPMPYLFLVEGLPQVQAVYSPYYAPAQSAHDLTGNSNLREKFINDWVDVITQVYIDEYLVPMKEWLNGVGIETRAQISYGRSFEITEPSAYVDYPEAEDFNQYGQVDIFRLHTAGSKLQNKTLSTETGAAQPSDSSFWQQRLFEAYAQYAAGFQRINWHIWGSKWGYEKKSWPAASSGFDRYGRRDGTFSDYDEINSHIGRVQQLMMTGKSRTDIGFIHNNWNQAICFNAGITNNFGNMNWQFAHMGIYYRSTELQDNGYTYDYLSPDLLKAEGVYFDEETKTVELAGYKALVIYQNWLDADGAALILEWAKKGLPVFIMEGAAIRTPFADGRDAELAETLAELRKLPNVKDVEIYGESEDFDYFKPMAEGYDDGLYAALQELGVRPYAEFVEPNHQLVTQTRTDDEGNLYLYAYNYCPNDFHDKSHIEAIQTEDHGLNIQTEIKMDGMFVPYFIDAWSGEVTAIGNYRYENGQTVFPIDLDYNNVALFAFEAVENEQLHIVDTDAASAYVGENGVAIRATESGRYFAEMNDGVKHLFNVEVPEAFDITGWDLTVESWESAGNDAAILSTETMFGLTNNNYSVPTKITEIPVKLDKLTTWDNIPEVGLKTVGQGFYKATFNWDAEAADGAYIDFGSEFYNSMEVWVNGQKVGGKLSTNPTKAPVSIIEGQEGKTPWVGGISLTNPVADIGAYLVDGENTIELVYSSNLGNKLLNRENLHNKNWWSIKSTWLPNGPAQAVVIPYVDEEVGTVGASLTGPDAAILNDGTVDYTVSVTGADKLATATLTFAVEGYTGAEVVAAEGWEVLTQTFEDGVLTAVLFNNAGVSGNADIATVAAAIDWVGAASVKMTNAVMSAYVGEGEAFVNAVVDNAVVETEVNFHTCDVNQDGVVDQLDITRAQRFFGAADEVCDVTADGIVNTADLIMILNNYTA